MIHPQGVSKRLSERSQPVSKLESLYSKENNVRETSRRRLLATCCAVALLIFAGATSAWAQTGTSALTGTVLDNSNSVVPGATVTLTQTAVGLVRTTTSNSSGLFH